MNHFSYLAVLVMMLTLPLSANAGVITHFYGDQDGFGIGVTDGQAFDSNAIVADDPADVGTVTDTWLTGGGLTGGFFDATGIEGIVGATLEVFTGSGSQLLLYFGNGRFVREISDSNGRAHLHVVDVTDYTSDRLLTIRLYPTFDDAWALDYAKLTIRTADARVPEPASIGLLGAGFFVIGLARRRLRQRC